MISAPQKIRLQFFSQKNKKYHLIFPIFLIERYELFIQSRHIELVSISSKTEIQLKFRISRIQTNPIVQMNG